MSQPSKDKNRARRARIRGIILGVVLAFACRAVPAEYQTACNVVAELTAIGGCGG